MFPFQLSAFVHRIMDGSISPIPLLNQDEDSNQEIGDDKSDDTGKSTLSSDIEEDNLDF